MRAGVFPEITSVLITGSGCAATGSGVGGLLDDDVRVGAADPEGRHACPARPVDCGPRHAIGGDGELRRSGTGIRGEPGEVQMRRNVAVVHAEHGLDEAGDTGGVLQVAQVGLDRAQYQWRRLFAIAENLAQGVEFDRVTQRGAGAVRLDVVDLRRLQPRRRQRRPQDRLLGRTAGHGLPAARTVLVDGRTPNQGQHRIPVAHCITEPLEYDRRRSPRCAHSRWRRRRRSCTGRREPACPTANRRCCFPESRSGWFRRPAPDPFPAGAGSGQARWMATSDDEHAVSSTTAGPCTPRKYDSRPAAKFDALPNGRYGSNFSGRTPCRQSKARVVARWSDRRRSRSGCCESPWA